LSETGRDETSGLRGGFAKLMFDLQPFKDVVSRRCGLSFDELGETNLAFALAKRMEATGSETWSAYFNRVSGDDSEFQELVALLTVNETYFFRESIQITYVVDCVVPGLLKRRNRDQPIRILSAGCSTGEEPYSIAIALKEKFGESAGRLVSIVGVDIDHKALATAHRAEYGEFSFRALSPGLRDGYFLRKESRHYKLHDEVRSLVAFHRLNLLSPQYPEALHGFDIVFFRNVSIYFDEVTRQTILTNLHRVMTEKGVLFLGAAETLANDFGIFHLVREGGNFHFTKCQPAAVVNQGPKRSVLTPVLPIRPKGMVRVEGPPVAPTVVPATPIARDWAPVLSSLRALLREKRFQEALQVVRAASEAIPGDNRGPLLDGYVQLQMRQFAAATLIGSEVVERDPWSTDAHMLLALSAKWQGDTDGAVRYLKIITYVMPDCWPAHYFLGSLLQDLDAEKAHREYGMALHQIEANPDPDGGLGLPLDLPVTDIRFLCERRRALLDVSLGEP